jgi:hypothetical protein
MSDIAGFDDRGPFALSMVGLGNFVRHVPRRREWPLVVSVGDTADDFALALALDRCLGPALWVPPGLLGSDTIQILAAALSSTRIRDDGYREVHFTSCSLDSSYLEGIASELDQARWTGTGRVSASKPVPLPPTRP